VSPTPRRVDRSTPDSPNMTADSNRAIDSLKEEIARLVKRMASIATTSEQVRALNAMKQRKEAALRILSNGK
jgi:hypothetical protein